MRTVSLFKKRKENRPNIPLNLLSFYDLFKINSLPLK